MIMINRLLEAAATVFPEVDKLDVLQIPLLWSFVLYRAAGTRGDDSIHCRPGKA